MRRCDLLYWVVQSLLLGCGQTESIHVPNDYPVKVEYWNQVNEDGFGNPQDFYAWSMVEFHNHLYVGTNNFTWQFPTLSDGMNVWRSDDGMHWEQVASDGFGSAANMGTRNMIVFQDHLYIGTMNPSLGAEVWRSHNGTDWEQVVSQGFGFGRSNGTIRGMEVFGGDLYVGTTHIGGGQVWRSPDGREWVQVNENGFGDPSNAELSTFQVFQEALYVGTINFTGAELWRTWDGGAWEKVTNPRFHTPLWDPLNWFVLSMASWRGHFYVGTFNVLTGGEIWRSPDGVDWQQVNTDGFGSPLTHYIWKLTPFRDPFDGKEYLYAGTIRFHILGWTGEGFQLWRTEDGTRWVLEIADGFGNPLNYGARTLLTFKDRLYLGTATNIFEPGEGCEVWRTDRPCPDADGDGYAASWCMGPDTDDTDPQIVPELSMLKQRFRWRQDGSIYTPTW